MRFDGQEGPWLVLAHGAGAPMDSEAMVRLVKALNEAGVGVVRFEFDFMAQRRNGGSRRPPPGQKQLLTEWCAVIEAVDEKLEGEPLFIGGKSLGGRMASLLLTGETPMKKKPRGGLAFGYPFHPPAQPDRWRTGHFPGLTQPLWIAQGERDPFGKRAEVEQAEVSQYLAGLHWVTDADHDLRPAKRSGLDWQQALAPMACEARRFMDSVLEDEFCD